MHKRLTSVAALGMAAVMALPLQAEPTHSSVAAVVNGEEITLGHVVVAYATLPDQYKQLPTDVLYGAILDQLISQTLLRQANGERVPRHVALSLDNERRSLLAAEEVERIMTRASNDEDIEAAYKERYSGGPGEAEFNASHILLESEEEANRIKALLDEGADFAETAKTHSTGPSGPNGGSLGWFSKGAMVPPFEDAVVALKVGQVSGPVETRFGWHIIKLAEKRNKEAPKLEEVRDQIEQELRSSAVETRIEELMGASEIERPAIVDLDFETIRNLDFVRE